MKILVINCGSSSIKCQLFDMDRDYLMASVLADRVGLANGRLELVSFRRAGGTPARQEDEVALKDHEEGLNRIMDLLTSPSLALLEEKSELRAVGHRVVHGGERFRTATLITDAVLEAIRENSSLAPLHNPPNLLGIEIALRAFPGAKQVAVFDTAFHQTMPPEAFLYPIPFELYEKHRVRRYGFHGSSHAYVTEMAAEILGTSPKELNVISIHLGNGASMAAVQGGKCIDSTMGFTPLAGLMMGTRPGDIDPYLPIFLQEQLGMASSEVTRTLNQESGLKGICGISDMREVVQRVRSGDERAELALKMYAYRIKKHIGALFAALGRLDSLVFTAGIGENVPEVRELCCAGLERLGIIVDRAKNNLPASGVREIGSERGEVRILVIPTNEEKMIAREVQRVLGKIAF